MRRVNDPPDIAEWIAAPPSDATRQYVSVVRRFSREGAIQDFASVSEADLVTFVVAIRSLTARRKAVSALEEFFGHLLDRERIERNPARRLASRVRKAARTAEVRGQLLTAGLDPAMLDVISWREVAQTLVDGNPPRPRIDLSPAVKAAVRDLAPMLLERMARTSMERIDELLDLPVQ